MWKIHNTRAYTKKSNVLIVEMLYNIKWISVNFESILLRGDFHEKVSVVLR